MITEDKNCNSILYSFDLDKNEKLLDIPIGQLAYSKEKETDYSCISYMTSRRKPDIYAGEEVIKSKFYRVNYMDNQASKVKALDNALIEKEKTFSILAEAEVFSTDSSSDEKNDIERMKKQEPRYYHSGNISFKCYNCDEVGHTSRNCPNEKRIICHKCNQQGHIEENCPNMKCFKCNRIGHRSFECTVKSQEIEKCENCKNVGHMAEDCLITPLKIKKSFLNNYQCIFCRSKGHLICPYKKETFIIEEYLSDNVEISESEEDGECKSEDDFYEIINKTNAAKMDKKYTNNKNITNNTNEKKEFLQKKRKRIINKLDNKDILKTIFCPKCGDQHSINDCNLQLKFNAFDQRRQNYSKSFFYEGKDAKNKR